MRVRVGIDIGSISINTVVMNSGGAILRDTYTYCKGRPFQRLYGILEDLLGDYNVDDIELLAFTGSGGQRAAELIGGAFVNEVVAQAAAVAQLHPEARTVIEMGGEDSKLIRMEPDGSSEVSRLSDFTMNSACAAGTGSFLDQQANRIGVPIEEEFGRLALQSEKPPRIAGRCSVFAKSDMIHLQQVATPVHDIVAGLCFAVARNFKSTMTQGRPIEKPVLFQGGVASNAGVVRAFRELLDLADGELVIPDHHASMGAIGAVYYASEHDAGEVTLRTDALAEYLQSDRREGGAHRPLAVSRAQLRKDVVDISKQSETIDVALGIDVGSLSTNVVLIDAKNQVVARRYLPTASRPLEAIRRGLSEIAEEVGDRVRVIAAGTTGSGRYLTGDFIGADAIRNEITAQATAAIAHDPTVDTIFEIGGQDSKYISIRDGVVVDFEMNKVCAAGTGSFLQEQAEKLGIDIVGEFGEMAISSQSPTRLGDRCTVFMESDVNSHQQRGASTEDLVGGLAYSIVQNYIKMVVGDRPIGDRIFFQGGVTNNKAVVAAFEAVTRKSITIPPHFDVTGAIGAAMIARDAVGTSADGATQSRFKGFDVASIEYTTDAFTCHACSNQCEIHRVRIAGEKKPLFYGARCERYEVEERKGRGKDIPNYFEERLQLLVGDFVDETEIEPDDDRVTIGIPRGLMAFYQRFPFWRTFFGALGMRVVLSPPSDRRMVAKSLEMLTAETCFPVGLIHGHVRHLLDAGVQHVFLPFAFNSPTDRDDNPTVNYNCPWIQSYPFMIRGALKGTDEVDKLMIPTLHMKYPKVLRDDLASYMKERFGTPRRATLRAIEAAYAAQATFQKAVAAAGRRAIDTLPKDKVAAVVLGRPYNTGDPQLNLSLIEKLIGLDVVPLPVDYLPIGEQWIFDDYPKMYWPNGQKILQAARHVAGDDRLEAIYLGNFRCGPDSFLMHYVREELRSKPFLHLEVDEHSADAGLITRCEAFLDSLRGRQKTPLPATENFLRVHGMTSTADAGRVLWFPYMRASGYAIAAASRSCGVEAHVLPEPTERDIELGRKYTNSRECFPMICTTGGFLRRLIDDGADPARTSFFMPDHNGPCRFGQYNRFQRILFNRLGYEDVSIVSPGNDNAYADLSAGNGNRFRIAALRGMTAIDLLRKMQLERRPYEKNPGDTDALYDDYLSRVVQSVEEGAGTTLDVMRDAGRAFARIQLRDVPRKPVIAVVGEIFMRDNSFCNGRIVERVEALGGEVLMTPFVEWLTYSSYRFVRDSRWKRDISGVLKAKVQQLVTRLVMKPFHNAVEDVAAMEREIEIEEMLEACDPYIHHDYDGDPPLNLGTSALLVERGVSGFVNILPFACMPGTLVASLSTAFRKDHDNVPWVNISYDGQDDAGLDTRMQAFMYQAEQYAESRGFVRHGLPVSRVARMAAVANVSG